LLLIVSGAILGSKIDIHPESGTNLARIPDLEGKKAPDP
jgi:hypothetical protein